MFNDHARPGRGPGQKALPSFMHLRGYAAVGQPETRDLGSDSVAALLPIVPPGAGLPRAWRTVVVEVSPAGARAWAAETNGPDRPFNPPLVPADRLEQSIADRRRRAVANAGLAGEGPAGPGARGSIGLVVRLGHGSFRNVTVEPLQP